MIRRRDRPLPPRDHDPDLPPQLDTVGGLRPRDDLDAVRLVLGGGELDAAHARLSQSQVAPASVGRVDLTGAVLTDVAVDRLGAVELIARDGTWLNVVIDGGRIGTLSAPRAEWDGVTLRGLRIDYLSLPSARLSDVLIVDCAIGTLDLPEAHLERVRVEGSRVDEVDTRGLRGEDLDLRGLDALSFTDVRSLAGATLSERQVELHAVALARALAIDVRD